MGGKVNKIVEPITNKIKEKIAEHIELYGKKPEMIGITVDEMKLLQDELGLVPPFAADGVLINVLN